MRYGTSLVLMLLLVAGVAQAQTSAAVAPQPPADSPIEAELFEDGWVQVAPHVYQRPQEDGSLETLAYGKAALELVVEKLRPRLTRLEERFERTGNPDLLSSIAELERHIAETERELALVDDSRASIAILDGLTTSEPTGSGCSSTVTRSADARPTPGGPEATAQASFSDSCNGSGDVFAHSEAEGHLGSDFRTSSNTDDPPQTTGSSFADAEAFVEADTFCRSYAYAEVRIQDDLGNWATFFDEDTDTECRRNLTVSINAKAQFSVPCGMCVGESWVADTNLPVDTYTWRLDGSLFGGNSQSVSETYCSPQLTFPTSESHTISVQVSDSFQSASDSHDFTVSFEACELSDCDPTVLACPTEEEPIP